MDVGVKQDLLHMLLRSYNPVWLKLGLEVRERDKQNTKTSMSY